MTALTQEEQSRLDDFLTEARSLRQLIDDAETLGLDQFALQVFHCLPRVISAASLLPAVAPEGDGLYEGFSDDAFRAVSDRLVRLLGPHNAHASVFDPRVLDDQPVVGYLADDLADVYRELAEVEMSIADGTHPRDALWQARFDFWMHWGRHATSALAVLYAELGETGGTPMLSESDGDEARRGVAMGD
jgi:hypothetical protein